MTTPNQNELPSKPFNAKEMVEDMVKIKKTFDADNQNEWENELKRIIGDLAVADDYLPDKDSVYFYTLYDFVTRTVEKKQQEALIQVWNKADEMLKDFATQRQSAGFSDTSHNLYQKMEVLDDIKTFIESQTK